MGGEAILLRGAAQWAPVVLPSAGSVLQNAIPWVGAANAVNEWRKTLTVNPTVSAEDEARGIRNARQSNNTQTKPYGPVDSRSISTPPLTRAAIPPSGAAPLASSQASNAALRAAQLKMEAAQANARAAEIKARQAQRAAALAQLQSNVSVAHSKLQIAQESVRDLLMQHGAGKLDEATYSQKLQQVMQQIDQLEAQFNAASLKLQQVLDPKNAALQSRTVRPDDMLAPKDLGPNDSQELNNRPQPPNNLGSTAGRIPEIRPNDINQGSKLKPAGIDKPLTFPTKAPVDVVLAMASKDVLDLSDIIPSGQSVQNEIDEFHNYNGLPTTNLQTGDITGNPVDRSSHEFAHLITQKVIESVSGQRPIPEENTTLEVEGVTLAVESSIIDPMLNDPTKQPPTFESFKTSYSSFVEGHLKLAEGSVESTLGMLNKNVGKVLMAGQSYRLFKQLEFLKDIGVKDVHNPNVLDELLNHWRQKLSNTAVTPELIADLKKDLTHYIQQSYRPYNDQFLKKMYNSAVNITKQLLSKLGIAERKDPVKLSDYLNRPIN